MNPPSLQTDFGSRLVPLTDGRMGLRGAMHMSARQPDPAWSKAGLEPGAPVLDFVASDDTLDRYDETIVASGWQLANYLRNPVFQNSHKYGDIMFTLGKSLVTEVRNVSGRDALCQRILFATGINPMAKIAHDLYKGGFLNAVSVGFIPIRWENGSDQAGYRRKYVEQELLELSAVAVPANPNALVMGIKSGAVEISDVRELAAMVQTALKAEPVRVASLSDTDPVQDSANVFKPGDCVQLSENYNGNQAWPWSEFAGVTGKVYGTYPDNRCSDVEFLKEGTGMMMRGCRWARLVPSLSTLQQSGAPDDNAGASDIRSQQALLQLASVLIQVGKGA